MSYNSELQSNNVDLQAILDKINALPEASDGVELPELANQGTAADLLLGKELIDGDGNKVVGTHECPVTEPKLQAKTITPTTSQQTVKPDSNYDGLSQVTVNAMLTQTLPTPSIKFEKYKGLITATNTLSASGYIEADTKSSTMQVKTLDTINVTPSTIDQIIIEKDCYITEDIFLLGDSNLVPDNIKNGISIFGVTGSYEGSGGSSSGDGIKVAKGTMSSVFDTVSGLGFKPQYVEVMALYNGSSYAITSSIQGLICLRYGTLSGVSFNEWVVVRGQNKYLYGTAYSQIDFSVTFTDDGFKISNAGGMSTNSIPGNYSYIAIG